MLMPSFVARYIVASLSPVHVDAEGGTMEEHSLRFGAKA